ncbi:MAG: hypothetical protein D6741_05115 [Planctomycetota bacterium]|nr:MAG: hypothetical protein D6741_05115 [Planctomycetota bacterium]
MAARRKRKRNRPQTDSRAETGDQPAASSSPGDDASVTETPGEASASAEPEDNVPQQDEADDAHAVDGEENSEQDSTHEASQPSSEGDDSRLETAAGVRTRSVRRILAWTVGGGLAGLIVAGAVLWWLGGREYRYTVGRTLDAAPEDVFFALTDDAMLCRWMEGVVAIEPVGDKRNEPGAKARVVIETEDGTKFFLDDEVLRYEPNQLLEVRLTSSMFTVTTLYRLEPQVNGRTKLEETMTARYLGPMRLFAPFAGSSIRRQLEGDLERLAALLAEETPAETPSHTADSP